MGPIIVTSFFLILCLFAGIYSIYKHEELWAIILCFVFAIGMSVGLYFSIQDYKYGDHKELVTVYGMKHTGIDTNGTYTKDNLVFTNLELNTKYTNEYKITDMQDMDINLHEHIINYIFNVKEGTIQLIYEYLKDFADHFESLSEITIYNNHLKLYIKYYSESRSIEYQITEEKEYKIVETDDGDERKDNPYYEKRYVIPEVKINHYNDDYKEFDSKLIKLLFDEDINKAIVKDNYTGGIHHLSYCFSKNCIYND